MNVLLLMAGSSAQFEEAGFAFPKNFVEIDGLPLVQRVVESLEGLTGRPDNRLVAVVSSEENRRFHTSSVVKLLLPEVVVIEAIGETAGAACSALLAIEQIDTAEPLLILNGDQVIDEDLSKVVESFEARQLDAGVVVFQGVHPRWSYVRCNEFGEVVEAAEKRPISRMATAGAYYYRSGSEFVRAVANMIRKDAQVGGLFYICPAFNELVLRGLKIGVHEISGSNYHSLATPQGVLNYEESIRARRVGNAASQAQ